MSLRPPRLGQVSVPGRDTGLSVLEAEMMSEAAAALGRAGTRAEAALARLTDPEALEREGRDALLKAAAEAVWALFIQREACGMRDQKPVIADLGIPRAVLVRLGAR
ncbi:DUF6665 family protein [Phenylobacterium sp.]|jgi:hypothetical protein|uniref:DUF6665 family protein n=1 Tax=Phenylobacterium sp. TaxID=1871053 RepID=UPI0025E25009|nr:DUF6665 family protein [Phenylobacterium sp.]MCA3741004.1 hypothetical protein [Phenylobacterium sp.]MCA3754690.1 hypothetical protein [Phenylobacterium sp.]